MSYKTFRCKEENMQKRNEENFHRENQRTPSVSVRAIIFSSSYY